MVSDRYDRCDRYSKDNKKKEGKILRERDIEKYLVSTLSVQKVTVVKFIPDGMTGMPDRLVLLPEGRVIWVELKTEGGRLSEIQKYRHEELRRMGQQVVVLWNKQQVDDLVERIAERIKRSTGSN